MLSKIHYIKSSLYQGLTVIDIINNTTVASADDDNKDAVNAATAVIATSDANDNRDMVNDITIIMLALLIITTKM